MQDTCFTNTTHYYINTTIRNGDGIDGEQENGVNFSFVTRKKYSSFALILRIFRWHNYTI